MFAYVKPEQKQKSKSAVGKREAERTSARVSSTGIPEAVKTQFENLSGFSFDDVRVHYNSDKPAQLQALAYTQGNQVYVAPGQSKHLEHELGHVVQQKMRHVKPTAIMNGLGINDDKALEHEADAIAAGAAVQRKTAYGNNLLKDGLSNCIQGVFPDLAAKGVAITERALSVSTNNSNIVQRRLNKKDMSDYTEAEATSVESEETRHKLLGLIASENEYYLPFVPDFTSGVKALEKKAYLLGEYHASSKWDERVANWQHIDKMFEAYKGIDTDDESYKKTIRPLGIAVNKEIFTSDSLPEGYPLESLHVYTLTRCLVVQKALHSYRKKHETYIAKWRIKRIIDGDEEKLLGKLLLSEIKELHGIIGKYGAIILDVKKSGRTVTSGYYDSIDELLTLHNLFENVVKEENIIRKDLHFEPRQEDPPEVQQIKLEQHTGIPLAKSGNPINCSRDLADMQKYLNIMIDKLKILCAQKFPNETSMAAGTIDGIKSGTQLEIDPIIEVNPIREAAMKANIQSAAKPLLVKIGNLHVASLHGMLPENTVAIDKDADFDNAIKR